MRKSKRAVVLDRSAPAKVLGCCYCLLTLVCMVLVSCTPEVKESPVVTTLADPALIDWDNAKVSVDSKIVKYAGRPFLKTSQRDKEAEVAVDAYINWKGGTAPYLPVKTAVEDRVVEDWRAVKLSPSETFIAGGAFKKPEGVIDQSWILEPKTSRIKDGPQLLRARKSCTLTALSNGKILISGGLDGSGTPIDECELYDPKNQTMARFAPLAMPRNGHTVIEIGGGKLVVVGGKTVSNRSNAEGDLTSNVEVWSQEKNKFDVVGKVKQASFQPQLLLIDKSHVFITNGHKFSGDLETTESPPAEIYSDLASAEMLNYQIITELADSTGNSYIRKYSIDTDAINAAFSIVPSTASLFPVKDSNGTHELAGWGGISLASGKVFMVGGVFVHELGHAINKSWTLDVKAKRLVAGANLLNARADATLTRMRSGKILVSGGQGENLQYLRTCEIFDTVTGKFSKFAPLESERAGHTVAELDDGTLVVFGGRHSDVVGTAENALATIEVLKPGDSAFSVVGKMHQGRENPTLYVDTAGNVLVTGGTYFAGISNSPLEAGSELLRGEKLKGLITSLQ